MKLVKENFVLRSVELKDFLAIAETLEDYPINGGVGLSQTMDIVTAMRRRTRDGLGYGLVFEKDEEIIGFACIAKRPNTNNQMHLTLYAIHPSFRGLNLNNNMLELVGYYAFRVLELSSLTYTSRLDSLTGASILEAMPFRHESVRPSVQEPDMLIRQRLSSAEDWLILESVFGLEPSLVTLTV